MNCVSLPDHPQIFDSVTWIVPVIEFISYISAIFEAGKRAALAVKRVEAALGVLVGVFLVVRGAGAFGSLVAMRVGGRFAFVGHTSII